MLPMGFGVAAAYSRVVSRMRLWFAEDFWQSCFMTKRNLARFGGIVRSRREELGLQQEEVKAHGGPSSTTMSGIERGVINPAPFTLRKLDAGLQWTPGSAAKVLDGGDPAPLPEEAVNAPDQEWKRTGYPPDDIPDMTDFVSRLAATAAELADEASPSQVVKILYPAVQLLALTAQSIGTKMRQEESVLSAPHSGAAEWMAVYAEYIRELSAAADVTAAALATALRNGESDVVEAAPQSDASTEGRQGKEVSARKPETPFRLWGRAADRPGEHWGEDGN